MSGRIQTHRYKQHVYLRNENTQLVCSSICILLFGKKKFFFAFAFVVIIVIWFHYVFPNRKIHSHTHKIRIGGISCRVKMNKSKRYSRKVVIENIWLLRVAMRKAEAIQHDFLDGWLVWHLLRAAYLWIYIMKSLTRYSILCSRSSDSPLP